MKGIIQMKTKFMKALTLCLALILCFSCTISVSAAEVADATIDPDADCSLTIFKYDWTNAVKDGVWNENSFISTGWQESYVEEVLGGAIRTGDPNGTSDHSLGNGQTSYGYALKGIEFTILRVADIVTFTESNADQHPEYNMTQVLYGFDKTASANLLKAIGLANGAGRYENADATEKLDANNYYYTSDTLNKALSDALAENATTVKNALEAYIASSNAAIAMNLTNEYGKAKVSDLDTGLWLVLETKTNEAVTSTTAPFMNKCMAGDYEIIQSFHIGDQEVVIGENQDALPEERYMCAYCQQNEIVALYNDVLVSDDFCEIAKLYGERLAQQAEKTRVETFKPKFQGIDTTPLTKADCTPLSHEDDLNGKVVVIKPEVLRREYQMATNQIKLCTGGFGASPHSRGSACFCVDLYSGKEARFERQDILGTLEQSQLPQWAALGLEQYQNQHRQISHKGREER